MKIFDLAPAYRLQQRFGYLAKATAARAEKLKLPSAKTLAEDCIIVADRRTGQMRVYLIPVVVNRMYNDLLTNGFKSALGVLAPQPVCNVRIKPLGDRTEVPWYRLVTPVGMDALGDVLTFFASPDTVQAGAVNFNAAAPQWNAVRILNKLQGFGLDGSWAARYALAIMPVVFRFHGRDSWGGLEPLVISEPFDGDNFQVLFGSWYAGPNDEFDPTKPRTTQFNGLSCRIKDLQLIAKDQDDGTVLVDFDAGSTDPSYVGPRYFGTIRDGEDDTTTFSGEVVGATLLEEGEFNLGAFSDGHYVPRVPNLNYPVRNGGSDPNGTEYWSVYSPNAVASEDAGGRQLIPETGGISPYVRPLFIRHGKAVGTHEITWDASYKAVKVDSGGGVVVDDISTPTVTSSVVSTSLTGVSIDTANDYACAIAFFDGERFRKIGSVTHAGSARTYALCADELGPENFAQPFYFPAFGLLGVSAAPSPVFVPESDFEVDSHTSVETALEVWPELGGVVTLPKFQVTAADYVTGLPGYSAEEIGFQLFGGLSDKDGPGDVRVKTSSLLTGTGLMNALTWYRPGEEPGLFLYAPGTGRWASDCDKYCSIYYGTLKSTDAGYEDPEVVLGRVMAGVTIYRNNFVSPELVPFIRDFTGRVIL